MSKISKKKQWELINRGAAEIIGESELKEKIESGKKLKIKFGADPTSPNLHLGHTVVMQKLRQFQDLGHVVVFIIGDFTAMIGDPSGRTKERRPMSKEEIEECLKTYEHQIFKILDWENLEIVRNSRWLNEMGSEGLIKLASNYTVAKMLERNDFSERYKKGDPLAVSEFLYPLLQGYDSVVVESDVEIGGTDQKFNLLVGRDFQKTSGQKPQAIMTMPLLEGTDGVKKMSKSYGNHIGIDEPPEEIFGKVMSISDELMYRYYTLLTQDNIDKVKEGHPMEAKKKLAMRIVSRFHGREEAEKAFLNFEKVFSEGQLPEDMPEFFMEKPAKITDVIYESGLVDSKSRIKRLIKQGAVTVDGDKVRDFNLVLKPKSGAVVRVGKRKFLKVIRK